MVVAKKKIWSSAEIDEDLRSDLTRELSCSPQIASILLSRGIDDGEKARRFLHPKLTDLLDPEILPEIDKAAERINSAIAQKESICVFGDYDVDGITSTCLLHNFFQQVGKKDVLYRLPDRLEGGYGLNCDIIRELAEQGINLLVTVDNGSSSIKEIELAAELGMDVVVCDHHRPPEKLPEPFAHINPWLCGNEEVFKDLAGVGVTYKLVWELCRRFTRAKKLSKEFRDFMCESLALAALGTIADGVPLRGENRILAKFGLEKLKESRRPGLRKLVDAALSQAGSRDYLTSEDVGYKIGPKINAPGRMGHADNALQLLMAEDDIKAEKLVRIIERENDKRKRLGAKLFEDVCSRIEAECDLEREKVIVLGNEKWHPGIVGIIASWIVDKYYKPVFLFSIEDDDIARFARGSARSIPGVDLYQAIARCGNLFERFGGHAMAAGGTILTERIPELRTALNDSIELKPGDMIPEIKFDCTLDLEDLDNSLISGLSQLEPFGNGNPKPLFATMGLEVVGEPHLMGKNGRHISFHVRQGEGQKALALRAVAFDMGERCKEIIRGASVSLLYRPQINTWSNREKIELIVEELRIEDNSESVPCGNSPTNSNPEKKEGGDAQAGALPF